MGLGEDARWGTVSVFQVIGKVDLMWIVGAGLEEKDIAFGILTEPRSENTTGRACAYDDVVVVHTRSSIKARKNVRN